MENPWRGRLGFCGGRVGCYGRVLQAIMPMQGPFFQAPILIAIVYFPTTYGEECVNFSMQIMQFYARPAASPGNDRTVAGRWKSSARWMTQ